MGDGEVTISGAPALPSAVFDVAFRPKRQPMADQSGPAARPTAAREAAAVWAGPRVGWCHRDRNAKNGRTVISSVRTIVLRLTLALALTVATSTAASGGGNCATRNEYRRLHEGMWRHRVTLIFGFVGDPGTHHNGVTTRRYVGCVSGTAAYVDFRYRRVVDKTWVRDE
jgi:hypothetical protein